MTAEVSSDKKANSENVKEFLYALKKFKQNKRAVFGLGLGVLLVFLALFAPLIVPYDPFEMHLESILQSPNFHYLLGTDQFGRDLLSRLIYGARLSLMIGIEIGRAHV
jgi:peptide/nickel transport system permease protein